jgi:hypothetical protein
MLHIACVSEAGGTHKRSTLITQRNPGFPSSVNSCDFVTLMGEMMRRKLEKPRRVIEFVLARAKRRSQAAQDSAEAKGRGARVLNCSVRTEKAVRHFLRRRWEKVA